MYNICVLGMGYTGMAIAKYFKSKNQRVYGIIRNPERKETLEKKEIIPVLADITKPETLKKIPAAHFIVIAVSPDSRDEESYRKIYLEGVRNFIEAIQKNPRPYLILYLSSTGAYGSKVAGHVTEDTPLQNDSWRSEVLTQAEEQILNSGYESIVFRLGGIYGPGRNRIERVKNDDWVKPEKNVSMNVIHRDDIVGAVQTLFKEGEAGKVYLGCDDSPAPIFEFYSWLSEKLGKKCDLPLDAETSGKNCSNKRLKALGYMFKYPTFKEGYEELLTTEGKNS